MMPRASLLGCAVALLLISAPEQSREAPARWKALAACGTTSMDSGDYDRRCRRFSRTDRATVREWDGPGAGAMRS